MPLKEPVLGRARIPPIKTVKGRIFSHPLKARPAPKAKGMITAR